MSTEQLTYQQIQTEWLGAGITDSYYKLPESTAMHPVTIYGLIKPMRRCGSVTCTKPAVAFKHERDHWGQEWIDTFCETHLSPNWAYELEQNRKERRKELVGV